MSVHCGHRRSLMNNKYILVDKSVLPEVFEKVIEAKEMNPAI